MSVITKIEFLAYGELSPNDVNAFNAFTSRLVVVGIYGENEKLVHECVRLRRETGLKLPDAIIAAQSLLGDAVLVTADSHFEKIPSLNILNYLKQG